MTSRSDPSKRSRVRRCPCSASHAPDSSAAAQPVHDALLHPGREQRPDRLGAPHARIEQCLGAAPERLEEPVGAVARRRYALHAGATAERRGDVGDRREPRPLDVEPLAKVLVLPRRQRLEVEREHDDGPPRHPAQLGQAGGGRIPVVDRHARHRGVDGAVVERQRLGARGDRGRRAGRAVGAHRRARLHREDPPVARLVAAAPGAHVQDGARIAEGGVDALRDPRVLATVPGVGPPVPLVVDVARRGHGRSMPGRSSSMPVSVGRVATTLPGRAWATTRSRTGR